MCHTPCSELLLERNSKYPIDCKISKKTRETTGPTLFEELWYGEAIQLLALRDIDILIVKSSRPWGTKTFWLQIAPAKTLWLQINVQNGGCRAKKRYVKMFATTSTRWIQARKRRERWSVDQKSMVLHQFNRNVTNRACESMYHTRAWPHNSWRLRTYTDVVISKFTTLCTSEIQQSITSQTSYIPNRVGDSLRRTRTRPHSSR